MVVNYEVGPEYRRFNQKNNAIMRSNWDPLLNDYGERSQQAINKHIEKDDRGFGLDDFAFYTASRAVVSAFGTSVNGPNSGLTSWEPLSSSDARAVPDELKNGDRASPTELQSKVRRVARHLGADLVGFTPLDERWVYTNHFLPGKGADGKGENPPVELPEGCDQVIVLGFEMDHDMMATAPTAIMMTETGRNYSRMAAHTASLAQFIRAMGYTAVPSLNDTALNVPLAIDAGLAQPSRLGPAITPEFGPRVRFCKVITNMPLGAVKNHREFGVVAFCEVCEKCADACPVGSLPKGPRTTTGNNISNNPGVLKWYGNYESCRRYWGHVGTNCGICIRVCPFNHGKGFHHDIAKWMIRLRWKWVNRLLVKMHGWFGYGEQKDPAFFWNGSGG